MPEIGRAILKTALARATAGTEGARFVGAQLAGLAGANVQAVLESLKEAVDGKLASASRGVANGVAELDANAAIPTNRIYGAGTATYGATRLSVAPATPATPIAAGDNDQRLTNTRTPTDGTVTDAKVAVAAAIAESKLALASDAIPGTASRRTLGTGAQQAAAGNDSRFHAQSHKLFSTDHADLNATDVPAGGEVLTFNGTTQRWEATAPSGGGGVHGGSHVSTGTDPIPAAVAGGASGLLLGTDKTKLDQMDSDAFFAHQSTQQLDFATGVFTKIRLNAKLYDRRNWFDAVTNFRFTPQIAGDYAFVAAFQLNPVVDQKQIFLALYKNGARYVDIDLRQTSGLAAAGSAGTTPPVPANGTTDFFELYVLHNLGVSTSDAVAPAAYFTTYFGGWKAS